MTVRAELASDILKQLPFPAEMPMGPEMLSTVNPDFMEFHQLAHIHPLIWGIKNIAPLNEQHLIAFMGPSASGKDTVLQSLPPNMYNLIITHTTREERIHTAVREKHRFVSGQQFSDLKQQGAFIEFQPEKAGLFGTTVEEMEKSLRSGSKIVVWRGEENGLPKIIKWLAKNHPEVQSHVAFILPQMPFVDLAQRIIEQRNPDEAAWRIHNAAKEIKKAGSVADFLILNPPQKGGPIEATEATKKLFTYLADSHETK